MDTLTRLENTIADRRRADPDTSYVASLSARGLPVIARKFGEEAVEDDDRRRRRRQRGSELSLVVDPHLEDLHSELLELCCVRIGPSAGAETDGIAPALEGLDQPQRAHASGARTRLGPDRRKE